MSARAGSSEDGGDMGASGCTASQAELREVFMAGKPALILIFSQGFTIH